jgi:hypothetical protein
MTFEVVGSRVQQAVLTGTDLNDLGALAMRVGTKSIRRLTSEEAEVSDAQDRRWTIQFVQYARIRWPALRIERGARSPNCRLRSANISSHPRRTQAAFEPASAGMRHKIRPLMTSFV